MLYFITFLLSTDFFWTICSKQTNIKRYSIGQKLNYGLPNEYQKEIM